MTMTSELPESVLPPAECVSVVDASEMDAVVDWLDEVDLDRLEAAIGAGAARIAALQCKWLLLLGEFVAGRGSIGGG